MNKNIDYLEKLTRKYINNENIDVDSEVLFALKNLLIDEYEYSIQKKKFSKALTENENTIDNQIFDDNDFSIDKVYSLIDILEIYGLLDKAKCKIFNNMLLDDLEYLDRLDLLKRIISYICFLEKEQITNDIHFEKLISTITTIVDDYSKNQTEILYNYELFKNELIKSANEEDAK